MSYATLPASSPVPPPLGHGTSPTGIVLSRRSRARAAVPPGLAAVIVATVAALAVQVGAAVLLAPGGATGLAVRVEQRLAPGLAAGMLLTAMFLATAARWAADGDTSRARHLWTVLTAVAAYFAAAENTALHQRLGRLLLDHTGTWVPERLHRPDLLRTALYAVVLGLLVLLLRREFGRYRRVRPLLALAAVSALAGTALDVAVRTPTVLTTLGVRVLHDTGAVGLALAALAGVVAARTLQADRDRRPSPDRRLHVGPALALVLGFVVTTVPAFVASALPTTTVPGLPPAGQWPPLAAAGGALLGAMVVLLGAVWATRVTSRSEARSQRDARSRSETASPGTTVTRGTTATEDGYADFWADRAATARATARSGDPFR